MAAGTATGAVGHTSGEGVVTLTLQRPALDRAVKEDLLAAVRRTAEDASARAVVLTGTGRAFCVGQDLAEHAAALRADPVSALGTVREHYNPVVRALAGLRVPVVVAVNGTCVGAGLGLALTGDLRVAAAGARFGTAFTGIGLAADSGLSSSLVHCIGASRASELVLLGEPFTAEQARDWGLVHRVVPAPDVLRAATELARRLAAGPTAAYAEVKALLRDGAIAPLDDVLEAEAAAQERLATTADHRHAVEAFLAKQQPVFEGR